MRYVEGEKNFFWIFAKNDPTTPNFMWKIDCAHSRSLKMLPWPWFREIRVCIEEKIFRFNTHSYFPESGSRKQFDVSGMRWINFSHKITLRTMILEEKCKIFASIQNIHFPKSGPRKHFQASGMRAINSPHKITFIWTILEFLKKISGWKNMKKSPKSRFFILCIY